MKAVILPNETKDLNLEYTKKIAKILEENGISAAFPAKYREYGIENVYEDEESLFGSANALIVTGGDGSVLRALSPSVKYSLPIFGINLGRLGYTANFEKGSEELISDMIKNGYEKSEKVLLSVSLLRNESFVFENELALNDAVIHKSGNSGVIETVLESNGERIALYRGDGVIFASPTGSTAYSLSAGGPILDPLLEGICVTPICPHSLRSRPIVFSKESSVIFKNPENDGKAFLSIDGKNEISLFKNDTVIISVSDKKAVFAENRKVSFCKLLYDKMTD